MESVKLYIYVALKHILDLDQKSVSDLEEDDGCSDDDDDDEDRFSERRRKRFQKRPNIDMKKRLTQLSSSEISKLDLLDLEGPKLIHGAKTLLMFYQIIGQLNWLGKPLYLSLLYKLIVLTAVVYNLMDRFLIKSYSLNILDGNYRNPIFLFISFLTILTVSLQGLVSFRANLLDLCPFFKILSTPKLCFVREEVQHIVGTKWLKHFLFFFVYHTLIISMIVSEDLAHFIDEFRILNFLADLYTVTYFTISMTGVSFLDLYVRSCFGHWLLALKNHIESRFTYLHKHQRRAMKLRNLVPSDRDNINSMDVLSISETITTFNTAYNRPLLTFDEIQKHLNKMDDHLEATRSVQIGSLVLLSLNAFLLNGALFLLSYHLLADQNNLYHGFLMLLLSFNCILIMFFCYSGDRWVFYALSSFTQTVEDEYFMQSYIRPSTKLTENNSAQQQYDQPEAAAVNLMNNREFSIEQLETQSHCQPTNHKMLLIKKKDVLFCHEFLHQFENHLATPWSNLTLKTHVHMLRTFVTLIAAQIIFDHEH